LAEYGELDGQLATLFTARVIGWRLKRLPDMAVRKGGRVEFRRFPRLAMVEPQTGDDFSEHRTSLTSLDDIPRYKLCMMQSIKIRFKIRLFVRDSCLQAQGRHAPWHDISASS